MLRTSKVHYKSSELYPILHEHFGKSMNLARIKALSMMVCALCKVQRVTYTKLAAAFDSDAASGSSLRRIQRLIAQCEISTDLIAKLILKLIPSPRPLQPYAGQDELEVQRHQHKHPHPGHHLRRDGIPHRVQDDGQAGQLQYPGED